MNKGYNNPSLSNSTTWKDMPEDYPKTNMARGSGWSKVTLRFDEQSVIYDPVMEVGDDVTGIETDEAGTDNTDGTSNTDGTDNTDGNDNDRNSGCLSNGMSLVSMMTIAMGVVKIMFV